MDNSNNYCTWRLVFISAYLSSYNPGLGTYRVPVMRNYAVASKQGNTSCLKCQSSICSGLIWSWQWRQKKLDAIELLKKTQGAWSNVSDKESIIGIAKYTVRYLTILFISLYFKWCKFWLYRSERATFPNVRL